MNKSSCNGPPNETRVQNLRDLSPENLREFLNSFDIIFCDCDGVIWMILGPIPRSGEAIEFLKSRGKQVKFVSNNSLRSNEEYMNKFKNYGINNVKENDIIHPAKTMAWYLKKHYPDSCTVFPLISPAAVEILQRNGIRTVPIELDVYNMDVAEFMNILQNFGPENVDAVLVDISIFTSYVHLVKALQYLKAENCQLILGAMDTVLPLAEKMYVPGFVDFYEILIKYSRKTPVILGKPSTMLATMLKECFSITDPKRCLFIGDSLRQDISFAKGNGFQSLFVLSGANTKDDMFNAVDEEKPDFYTESLGDLLDLIREA